MELRHRIKRARDHARLTQEEVAERVRNLPGGSKFSQQALSKLEKGESEEPRYLPWIAKACDIRTDWLTFEDGPMLRADEESTNSRLDELLEKLPGPQREQFTALLESMVNQSSGS